MVRTPRPSALSALEAAQENLPPSPAEPIIEPEVEAAIALTEVARRAAQEAARQGLISAFRRRVTARRLARLIYRRRMMAAAPATNVVNPYSAPISLATKHGVALYTEGAKPLVTTYDGQAKNLPTFLAELRVKANECDWNGILTITKDGTDRNILTAHGYLQQADVDNAKVTRYTIAAGAGNARTTAEAQGVIKAQMFFKCIKSSLTPAFMKNLTQVLPTFDQDGPSFIYYLIKEAQVTTVLATRDLTEELNTLQFRSFRYNIDDLHGHFDTIIAQLTASNAEPSDLNKMMYLFQAYKTNTTNPTFLRHIENLESDWSRNVLTTPAALRENVKSYINTLKRNKQWKGTKPPTNQPTASPAEADKKHSPPTNNGDREAEIKKLKSRNAAWKFDKKQSPSNKLTKNSKEYHWCTGPGHLRVGMWVIHEPGTCTGSTKKAGSDSQAHASDGTHGGSSTPAGNGGKKAQFKANVAQLLANSNTFGDDVSELVTKIVNAKFN